MKTLSYKAIHKNGTVKIGYIKEKDTKKVLKELEKNGYSEIDIINDKLIGNIREELKDLDDTALKYLVKHDLEKSAKESVFESLKEYFATHKNSLSIFLLILFFGLIVKNYWAVGAGLFLIGALFIFWILSPNYEYVYKNIHKNLAFGNYLNALELINRLERKKLKNSQKADLARLKANIVACRGHLGYAILILDSYKKFLLEGSPALYYSFRAMLYLNRRDYKEFLKQIQKAYESDPKAVVAVDLALAHSKFGNINYAKEIIETIDIDELPKYAKFAYYLALGNIAYVMQLKDDALSYYKLMLNCTKEHINNPAMWIYIALGIGHYAVLLADLNRKDEADEILKDSIVKIINIHADDYLRGKLTKRYPDIFDPSPRCK